MSAYNRKVLRKTCSSTGKLEKDCAAMDESGYASFLLHNSTVEAPFLFERDCETENCRNASNTAAAQYRLNRMTFNSTQFQTPSSSNESISNSNTTLWHKSLSLPLDTSLRLESDDDEMCKSPLPMSLSLFNQMPGASKRRKPHYQPMTHHSSPKKSKKKLFPQPSVESCRTRYYNGQERLDIISMLFNTVPALECILTKLSSPTLDIMTKVSDRWAQAVYKSERAQERLDNHRFKMSLTKENTHSVKRGRMLSKSINNHIVPLQPSNAIHKPNRHDNFKNIPMEDNCLLVEQQQRIKCPRCGKSSKVFYSQTAEQTPPTHRFPRAAALSQTLPHSYSFGDCKPPMARFYSLDEVKCSPDENEFTRGAAKPPSYPFGECTSILCKFRFCVHCYCPPHPGEKCLVTEMGTPSKVMMPSERLTPPRHTQKYDSKLSRKKSLKRLNF